MQYVESHLGLIYSLEVTQDFVKVSQMLYSQKIVLILVFNELATATNVFQDLYAFPQSQIFIHERSGPKASDFHLKVNGKTVGCHIICPNHQTVSGDEKEGEPDIFDCIAAVSTIPCLEFSAEEWKYSYCNNEIIQSFSAELFDTSDLTKEDIELLGELVYTLGKSSNHSFLSKVVDDSRILRSAWTNGEICDETGLPREVMVNVSRIN